MQLYASYVFYIIISAKDDATQRTKKRPTVAKKYKCRYFVQTAIQGSCLDHSESNIKSSRVYCQILYTTLHCGVTLVLARGHATPSH